MNRNSVVAALLATALTLGTEARPAAAGPSPAALRRAHGVAESPPRRSTERILAERFGDLDRGGREALARAAGFVRVGGRATLRGRIFAEGFTVERGAEVRFEPGTTIYSLGPVVIAGPMTALPVPAAPVRESGPPFGIDGSTAEDLVILCDEGNVTIEAHIVQLDGGDGQNLAFVGTQGQGGNGGSGGGILIDCENMITVGANLVPGRGGNGGSATVTGPDGILLSPDGVSVDAACGGGGGAAGDVRLVAPTIEFLTDEDGKALGRIALRPGGRGGDATAIGGAGSSSPVCDVNGGNGGDAFALGGSGGLATLALVESDILLPEDFGATDIAGFDEGDGTAVGGEAIATGGAAGSGADCSISDCLEVGRNSGDGGSGGEAFAIGGDGSSGGQIGGGKGVLKNRDTSGAESPPGQGGAATATGGEGGLGGFGEPGGRPGKGGKGGSGGKATAFGGDGASSKLGGLDGPLAGAPGGAAIALAGKAGDGGDGGDCCQGKAGAKGGKGGKGGKPGKAKAKGGKGGKGKGGKGARGTPSVGKRPKGANGATGAPCANVGGKNQFEADSFLKPPTLFVGISSEIEIFLYNEGPGVTVDVEIFLGGALIHSREVTLGPGDSEIPGFGLVEFFHAPTAPSEGALLEVKINGVVYHQKTVVILAE